MFIAIYNGSDDAADIMRSLPNKSLIGLTFSFLHTFIILNVLSNFSSLGGHPEMS